MTLQTTFFLLVSLAVATAADPISFNRDVRPILSENCFHCHGPDKSHREAKLRLDVREEAVASKAFVPGNPGESEMIKRILTSEADDLMPPLDSHKKLSVKEKEILQKWIAEGAVYQLHWSYQKPVKAVIPEGKNAVDVLVQQRLAGIGLTPSGRADARTLIRRLYSDLIGLPPSPEEVAAFVKDPSPEAYGELVNHLLKSPHYGERMAIGWLDVVRFADTIGYHSDNPRNIWPYRDWVIKSFNDNKRFDRFTLEQLAGDLLPDANEETKVGSAFNRLLLSTEEGGAQEKDYESRMLTDRVRAVGAAWMGQTTGCCQCHDHKFDPITQRDFYALGAFFADIKEGIVAKREEGMVLASADQRQTLAGLEATVSAAKKQLAALGLKPGREQKNSNDYQERLRVLTEAEKKRAAFYNPLPKCLVSVSTPAKRTVRILPRGDWMDESGEIVKPAVPHYLPQPKIEGRELTRLDLAQWLVSLENPLTARTVMNRLWAQFFGTGLSKVPGDLGAQGEPPVNGPLLDWLACEFMDSGWDFQHMVRAIVTSSTYQQVSTVTREAALADPYNRETARQSRFRIDAELVRDNALAISGLLVPQIGGPSVKPYQPARYWENINFPPREYENDNGKNQYRRGLYTWWQRSFHHPSMVAFDAPSREECTAERTRSNIPQQALVLLNDPSYIEAARLLAVRILDGAADTVPARITKGWQLALQRDPSARELEETATLLDQHLSDYQKDGEAAARLLKTGLTPVTDVIPPAELAAWTHVARVLLNLHETITRD